MTAEDQTKENDKTKQKNFDLPIDLLAKFESAYEEQKKLKNFKNQDDFAAFLLGIGLDGRRNILGKAEIPTMRKIRNLYENKKCRECGNPIAISQDCYWARDLGIVCIECHDNQAIESLSDATISRKYRTIRELEHANRGLKAENNQLSDKNSEILRKINSYELLENLYKASKEHHNKLPALEASLNNFMRSDPSKPEEQKHILEEVLKAIQQDAATDKKVLDATDELRAFLTHPFLRKKKVLPQTEPRSEEVPA